MVTVMFSIFFVIKLKLHALNNWILLFWEKGPDSIAVIYNMSFLNHANPLLCN